MVVFGSDLLRGTFGRRGESLRRTGFSLLELLVALTILAIALVPVAYFYSKSLQMVEKASIRTRALMLARERLTEIQQMPYERIYSNVTPSPEQLHLFSALGAIDTAAVNEDWYGYDFESNNSALHAQYEWAAMFHYALPLNYNPYRPQTQGYNNAVGAQHFVNNVPVAGLAGAHINFNSGGSEINYEYEPVGFYRQTIYNRNRSLLGDYDNDGIDDRSDIRMVDRRTLAGVEPSLVGGYDYFRTGLEQQVDKYDIYGRRTIILDVVPQPQDTDGDNYAPADDWDGGASAIDPYPQAKGPDNKFQLGSQHGTRGKMVIVQVFWLPRDAGPTYVPAADLNKIELRTFISASNESSDLSASQGAITRNNYLILE